MARRVGFILLALAASFAPGVAQAQNPDCQLSGQTTVVIGGDVAMDWRMRAGWSCAFRMRVGYRHRLESIAVIRRPRLGRAGASTSRAVDEEGRITLTIAYRSPANAPAGSDEFTVRAITRTRDTGERLETTLTYRVELWK